MATTRSFGPNHSAASFAGADELIGVPKAVINYPTITQAKE